MYVLTKFFTNRKFQSEFMAGSLYLSSMTEFTRTFPERGLQEAADKGDESAAELLKKQRKNSQRDIFEGTIADIDSKHIDWIQDDFRDLVVCDVKARALGYAYCNIQCFCMMEYNYGFRQDGRLVCSWEEPDMRDFGEYAVIIKDQAEFIRRVGLAAEKEGYQYLCGTVNYHPLMQGGRRVVSGNLVHIMREDAICVDDLLEHAENMKYDAFDKWDKYSAQQEWRIVINTGDRKDAAIRLEIGDLSDIAVKTTVENLPGRLNKILRTFSCCNSDREYVGNVSREEMRDEFYRIGGNKAFMFATLGNAQYEETNSIE